MLAIGALGGSGTRANAEVLLKAGVFLGDDLNNAHDNLLFTRLMKNPRWYKTSTPFQKSRRLRILRKSLESRRLSVGDALEVCFAAVTNPTYPIGDYKSRWERCVSDKDFYAGILKMVLKGSGSHDLAGWKEPNTQFLMAEALDTFSDLKYIHVIRHGLDMALSKNKQQLKNWGWKYDIYVEDDDDDDVLAAKQLDYWIASTKEILAKSRRHKDRFLLVNHSQFCENPGPEVDRILDFTGASVDEVTRKILHSIPKDTGSNNRYDKRHLELFGKKRVAFVASMGFTI